MRWLYALAALAGCYRPDPPEGAACNSAMLCPAPLVCDRGTCNRHLSDAPVDGPPTCTPPPAAMFAAPTRAGISTTGFEGTPTMTDDLTEVFFKGNRTGAGDDIYTATHVPGGGFGPQAIVAELSTSSNDQSPSVSADGLTIWLVSDRGGSGTGTDIYVATRASRGALWGTPVVVPELSSPSQDDGISVSDSQLVAYLFSDRDGSGVRMFRASRPSIAAPWSKPVVVDELGSDPENPWASPDDCTIYFQQSGPNGGDDLFFAVRPAPGEPFGPRQLLAPLSGGSDDDDPWLSPDQHYIMFASARTGLGSYDIYESSR